MHIKLEADIDVSGVTYTQRRFVGSFDGQGHSISGLTMPMFSIINPGNDTTSSIKNLKLINADITVTSTTSAGAIASTANGTNTGTTTIENCYVSGTITNPNYYAGGIVGVTSGTLTIKNCMVNADVSSNVTGNNGIAGGILGSTNGTTVNITVDSCIAAGTVAAKGKGGSSGILGKNQSSGANIIISNSYVLQSGISAASSYNTSKIIYSPNAYTSTNISVKNCSTYENMTGTFGTSTSNFNGDGTITKAQATSEAYWSSSALANNPNWTANEGTLPTLNTTTGIPMVSGELPIYLAETHTISGTTAPDAELAFTNAGGSTVTAIADAQGAYSIQLSKGTYNVLIKADGYLNLSDSITVTGDNSSQNFSMELNPAGLGADTTVSLTFITTDADTAEKSDSISLIFDGTPDIADFAISTSKANINEYDGITISAVTSSEMTISFTKALDLVSPAYLFYKGTYVGEVTLSRTVNKVALAAPETAAWDTVVAGKATWSGVANASSYEVQLYKENAAFGSAINTMDNFYDFTSVIAESGAYNFSVKAIGDGVIYDNSEMVTSRVYNFTEQSLADVKTAAEAALQNAVFTNTTTADDILSIVTNVITNKSITAEWSQSNGFVLSPATDGENVGVKGSITGAIILSHNENSENIELDFEIMPKFKFEYSAGGQTVVSGSAPVLENMYAGEEIILIQNPYTVYGFNFIGWTDGVNNYNVGDSFTVPENNTVLSARWDKSVWDGITKTEPKMDTDGYYMITSGEELAYFSGGHTIRNIKLMCDIDMGGHSFTSIDRVEAIFDGQGFTIKNLNVEQSDYGYMGLIGSSYGTIKNLIIKDAIITDKRSETTESIGVIVGMVTGGSIENCYVSGTIDGNGKNIRHAGGLVGRIDDTYSCESINNCYTDVQLKNFYQDASQKLYVFAGGIVGDIYSTREEALTISNCYSTSTFDGTTYTGGIVGNVNGSNIIIDKCYAAGKGINSDISGYGIAGTISKVSNCLSIFSEIQSCKGRISNFSSSSSLGTNNYAYFATNVLDSNNLITEPDETEKTTNGNHGKDALLSDITSQEFYANTLGWDFENVWKMPDEGSGYQFPVLKNQSTASYPTVVMDMTAEVKSITLDTTDVTLYRNATLKLNPYVDVLNGASRQVVWSSSNPNTISVDKNGLITVASDAGAGSYSVIARAIDNTNITAVCNITVNTDTYALSQDIESGPYGEKPIVKFYLASDTEQTTEIYEAQAGKKVNAIISPLRTDEGLDFFVNGEKVEPHIYSISESGKCTYIYEFYMPCQDVSITGKAYHRLELDNYVWVVVASMSSQGDTVAFSVDDWEDGTGYVKIDKIINGKKFVKFDVRKAYLVGSGEIQLTENLDASSYDDLSNGEYCTIVDSNGLPKLLLKLNGAGNVEVEIVVEEDENAVYEISPDAGSSAYYTLDKQYAKAGETITATLTQEGVQMLKSNSNNKALFNYGGGLMMIIFNPEFKLQADGSYQVSFTMPAQDIYTNVFFAQKTEITLSGYDVTVPYNGNSQSIDRYITALAGTQDISNLLVGRYDITYTGIDGTSYDLTSVSPSDVGSYECVVKTSEKDSLYNSSNTVTVKLTITKSTPLAPIAPKAIIRSANEITLTPPVAFVDGKEIASGYIIEYKCNDGEWTENATFTDLSQNTTYNFYARIKATDNNESSPQSEAVSITTPYGTPSSDYAVIDFVNETIAFDNYLEINTTSEFDGTDIISGSSITSYIGTTVYMRIKATVPSASEEVVSVVIPQRPDVPKEIVVLALNDTSVSLLANENNEYQLSGGVWQDSNIFENLNAGTAYKLYQRVKATNTSFASAAVEKDIITSASSGDTSIILTKTTVSVNNLSGAGTLILASYANGKLVQLKTVPVSSDAIHNVADIITITSENEIKAMLWNNLENLMPLCPSKSLSINK